MSILANRTISALFALTLVFGKFAVASCAQEMEKTDSKEMEKKEGKMMKKQGEMKQKEEGKPIVAVFRADWCPYCKKLEPIMMELMKEYGEKLNFVVFDITNEDTIAKSKELAKEKGLEKFFNENKDKSAFVVLFKDGKEKFKAKYKTEKAVYVKEFDKVLTKQD